LNSIAADLPHCNRKQFPNEKITAGSQSNSNYSVSNPLSTVLGVPANGLQAPKIRWIAQGLIVRICAVEVFARFCHSWRNVWAIITSFAYIFDRIGCFRNVLWALVVAVVVVSGPFSALALSLEKFVVLLSILNFVKRAPFPVVIFGRNVNNSAISIRYEL
jgi:hypothetical protein